MVSVLVLTVPVGGPGRAQEKPDVQTVLSRAIKAAGGEANLKKYQAGVFKAKGKMHDGGYTFSGEFSFQAPERMRMELDVDDGQGRKFKLLSALDGDKGWQKIGDDEPEALEGDTLKEEQEDAYETWVTMLVPLKDKAFRLSLLDDSKVGDRPAFVLKVVREAHYDVKLFFDKDDARLLKTERRRKDAERNKEVNEETFYTAYKDVQGLQQPTKVTVKWDGNVNLELEISEIKLKEKLDDSLFAKPKKDL
jgi:outer membrane lipoprotein-sorting protein